MERSRFAFHSDDFGDSEQWPLIGCHGSCKPLCKEVAAAVAKDSKGYPERLQTWIALTNEAYPNTDPDPASLYSLRLIGIYSVRLVSFFLMEIMACSETMQIKQDEYAFQLADLKVADVPAVYEYVHDIQAFALNAQQRAETSDLTLMGEALIDTQRVQRQERQHVLRRIMQSAESRLAILDDLKAKLKPFLPGLPPQGLHVLLPFRGRQVGTRLSRHANQAKTDCVPSL